MTRATTLSIVQSGSRLWLEDQKSPCLSYLITLGMKMLLVQDVGNTEVLLNVARGSSGRALQSQHLEWFKLILRSISCNLIYKTSNQKELSVQGSRKPGKSTEAPTNTNNESQPTVPKGSTVDTSIRKKPEMKNESALADTAPTASDGFDPVCTSLHGKYFNQESSTEDGDLVHFKRVQLSETKNHGLQQLRALNRLVLELAHLREEILTVHTASHNTQLQLERGFLDPYLSKLESCSDLLTSVLPHPVFPLLIREADVDWKTPQWSQAWRDAIHLTRNGKILVSNMASIIQSLKRSEALRYFWGTRTHQTAEATDPFIVILTSFKAKLDQLLKLDAAWAHGGQVATSKHIGASPCCMEVTSKYIIVSYYDGEVSNFDHKNSYVRSLQNDSDGCPI